MTIPNSTYQSAVFLADGVNRSFAASFKVFDNDQVIATVADDVGMTTNVLTYAYPDVQVADAYLGAAAIVATFPQSPTAPIAAGKYVRLERVVPQTQPDQIGAEGRFNPETHENAFDRLTVLVQQQYRYMLAVLNAAAANALGNMIPLITATYDIGSSALRWRDGFFSRNVRVAAATDVNSDDVVTRGAAQTLSNKTISSFGDAAVTRGALGALGAIKYRLLTVSGTYTPDPNLITARVWAQAPGGGGAGTGASGGGTNVVSGASGGNGGLSVAVLTKAQIGASKAFTIGSPGAGGAAGDNAGGAAGDVNFGSGLVVAKGGGGGRSTAGRQGGDGGVLTGAAGDIKIPGSPGLSSQSLTGNLNFAYATAPTMFGAPGSQNWGGAGVAGVGYGAGGQGGTSTVNSGAAAAGGGAGAPGMILVEEFCSA